MYIYTHAHTEKANISKQVNIPNFIHSKSIDLYQITHSVKVSLSSIHVTFYYIIVIDHCRGQTCLIIIRGQMSIAIDSLFV